jgi:addiction module HigA family antidote
MPMKNPPQVGGLIRREVIEGLGLTVTEAAKALSVGRQALSALLNEKAALTSNMALRIEKAFGPKMDHLMRMQLAYDVAQARKEEKSIAVKRYVAEGRSQPAGLGHRDRAEAWR